MSTESPTPPTAEKKRSPATQFFIKGLAITLPPILTVVILIWIANGVNDYVVRPISTSVRWILAQAVDDSRPADGLVRLTNPPPLRDRHIEFEVPYLVTPQYKDEVQPKLNQGEDVTIDVDHLYVRFGDWAVPYSDYQVVAREIRKQDAMPVTVTSLYMELVGERYFGSVFHLSLVAVIIAVVLLYFIGRIVTVRIGAWGVHKLETMFLGKLPVVSNVYSSVKQITDFLFTERTIEYNRVVAVEYPRRGIWSIGFVTGDGLLQVTAAAGEPMVSVLMPTSPMPMTGFTVTLPRSDVVDLDMTVDQAFQYCLSCGVLVPDNQKVTPELVKEELAKRFSGETSRALPNHPTPAPESPKQTTEENRES